MRALHKLYARVFGYFWKPCPMCGQMFGGHECSPEFGLMKSDTTAQAVCKNPQCIHDSAVQNVLNGHPVLVKGGTGVFEMKRIAAKTPTK